MAKFHPNITPTLQQFIAEQKIFFTATAAPQGRINISPKGIDTFRVLNESSVAYLDLTGSGNEAAAHLAVDNRMTIMFCSFEGKPLVLRLFGRGELVRLSSSRGQELHPLFGELPGQRHIIVLQVESVQTACGFAVPLFEFKEQRSLLIDWAEAQGEEKLNDYRRIKNSTSIDGLPAAFED